MSITASHSSEVARGERFEFGKNWSRFLKTLTVARIKLAERSLQTSLGVERLDGLSFLDAGSGSGLFSLAARRLGARVRSFDYDPYSYACTCELRQRYFPDDPDWAVETGSVLDTGFLAGLGVFDIVYAWGVLHHTGAMRQALENVKPLTPLGGRLLIAIYNDQGAATDEWARIKKTYNSLPAPLAFAYALRIIGRDEGRLLGERLRQGRVRDWVKTWTEYDRLSTRGMSRWHDWIDWIGGYPYERATVEQIVDLYAADGFALEHLVDLSSGYGCNEFVFRRAAGPGVHIDSQLPGGASMARRFGRRLRPPFVREGDGVYASPQVMPTVGSTSRLYLMRDERLAGPAAAEGGRVRIADAAEPDEALARCSFTLLAAEKRPLAPGFHPVRGRMWQVDLPDLAGLADTLEAPTRSGVFLFEDGVQLPLPHATHDQIARLGGGRFSHWEGALYFSPLHGEDPNADGREYVLLIAGGGLPADRAFAKLYGERLQGPFRRTEGGWMAAAPCGTHAADLLLLRDDRLIGPCAVSDGELPIAPPDADGGALEKAEVFVAPGRTVELAPPFAHQRGAMWSAPAPELAALADDATDGGSPVFLFEDGRQLAYPHSLHDDIDRLGAGRFSHWGGSILFSPLDGDDPNANGHRYVLAVPSLPPKADAARS